MRNNVVLKTQTYTAMINVANAVSLIRKCLGVRLITSLPFFYSTRHGCLYHTGSGTEVLQADSTKNGSILSTTFI
jgi:hypothetical protein